MMHIIAPISRLILNKKTIYLVSKFLLRSSKVIYIQIVFSRDFGYN